MQAKISEHIRRDLTTRLASPAGMPRELTLAALAELYGVSFTPVREAIRDLVADGVLLRQRNGRVQLGPRRSRRTRSSANAAVAHLPSRSNELVRSLEAEVIRRSLCGESQFLREEATAQRYGVGRTAIRQAFGQLAGRGLIVHVPRCGWRVRPFDEADLRAYLQVRESLELEALALAREHLVAADLKRMLAGNAPSERGPRLDNQLHRYLVEKSRNRYIQDFFDRQGAYYTALFDFAAPETRVVRQMARQHRQILRALLARDWTGARRALAAHIRAQQPIVLDLMRRIGRANSTPERQEPART